MRCSIRPDPRFCSSAALRARPLLVCADATFTNRTVLRDLPPRTTLLGRIRKDARLYALPAAEEENQGCGRRRCYGQRLPTPEQLRRDDSIPWKTVQAFAAGNVYDFDIKFITPLRWKNAGGERQLLLLIVRPVAYRLRQGAHLSYRNPAYLICSDPALPPQKILQAYLWRWGREIPRPRLLGMTKVMRLQGVRHFAALGNLDSVFCGTS